MSVREIELRRFDGTFVVGQLHDEIVPVHLLLVEQQWIGRRVELATELQRLGVAPERWPESLGWSWAKKAPQLMLLEATGFAISHDGKWQGAMLTKSATHMSRHANSTGKPLIYVDFVEVAPWNWVIEDIGQSPQFKGVGPTLLREAVLLSKREEFGGRVGLHSLPQAEKFYQGPCGMEPMGRDAAKENLMYFELTTEGAERFLNGG